MNSNGYKPIASVEVKKAWGEKYITYFLIPSALIECDKNLPNRILVNVQCINSIDVA